MFVTKPHFYIPKMKASLLLIPILLCILLCFCVRIRTFMYVRTCLYTCVHLSAHAVATEDVLD